MFLNHSVKAGMLSMHGAHSVGKIFLTNHTTKISLIKQNIHTINCNYLLGTGESYSPTAQHMQDSRIFFIQLNYVYNRKE